MTDEDRADKYTWNEDDIVLEDVEETDNEEVEEETEDDAE